MLAAIPFEIHSRKMLGVGVAVVLLLAIVVVARKPALPRVSVALILIGSFFLALGAGEIAWLLPHEQRVLVMVDLSPSTRGATFRDRSKLDARVHELLGDNAYELMVFADINHPADASTVLKEIPTDRTVFSPPPASAILLFSDARFEAPSSADAPVYTVADPGLEDVRDAAVTRLEVRNQTLGVTVRDTANRLLTLRGVTGPTTAPTADGSIIITRPLDPAASLVSAQLNPGDRWPENDSMSIRAPLQLAGERWWIGSGAPDPSWRQMDASQLPADPAAYLMPSVIVLNNIPADLLSAGAMDRLTSYARDLGGSVLLLGGDHAFAAGAYTGTAIEILSPLSSAPPQPTMRWMLLADSSGSMAEDAGGSSKWKIASAAIVNVLPLLPPQDPVDVGQISDVLRWWTTGKSALQTAALSLPPPDAGPHGPTNLEAALRQIGDDADASLPKQLLLLSDCQARIDNPASLADLLKSRKIHLYVLAIEKGSALPALEKIIRITGGAVMQQFDPSQWTKSIRELMQAAIPNSVDHSIAIVRFVDRAAALPSVPTNLWNRTWLKKDATIWAFNPDAPNASPLAAQWRFGSGQVVAVAFAPSPTIARALADIVAIKPRDPRFTVTWDSASQVRVSISAIDNRKYLNDLSISLEQLDPDSGATLSTTAIPQIAPGLYAATVAAPRAPTIFTVGQSQQVIDRLACPGRYAPEFNVVGNDHPAMRRLADQSGGDVIWPTDHRPINFHRPTRAISLSSLLAILGAAFIGAGLVRWRWA